MTALLGIEAHHMVQPLMFAGIGFLFAALIALSLSPAIHRRAERLTARRLNEQLPRNVQELRAEKDHLRAEHAVQTRNLTLGLEKLHEKAALQSAELGRKTEEANRLRRTLGERDAALADLERRASADGRDRLRAELADAQFESNAARAALREAERAILALQADIADLTAAVESRTRLIDRQQHDIMALTAQIDRISKAPPVAGPMLAQAALSQQKAAPQAMQAAAAPMKAAPAAQPAAAQPAAPLRAAAKVTFESRLAAIRDDKPLRDVRPQAAMKRSVPIEPAPARPVPAAPAAAPQLTKSKFLNELLTKPEIAKEIVKVAQTSVEKPAPAAAKPAAAVQTPPAPEAEPARVATDIRYDEPLTTAELLELGKAMLRQSVKVGPPHKTH